MNKVVMFQILQRLREHLLGTVCHETPDFVEAHNASIASIQKK
jgi:hypothetical protein